MKKEESRAIVVAQELQDVLAMPGWKHIEFILDTFSERSIISSKELANLNPNIIAYHVGKKDSITEFQQALKLNIKNGELSAKEALRQRKDETRRAQADHEFRHNRGY